MIYGFWNNKAARGRRACALIHLLLHARHPDERVLVIDVCPGRTSAELLLEGLQTTGAATTRARVSSHVRPSAATSRNGFPPVFAPSAITHGDYI